MDDCNIVDQLYCTQTSFYKMTMDGISGDFISTADIRGSEIDCSPVVPVVASSSITFQARSDTDDGLHNIGLSDASSLGSGKPAVSDQLPLAQHGETLSSMNVDVKGGRTIPEHHLLH